MLYHLSRQQYYFDVHDLDKKKFGTTIIYMGFVLLTWTSLTIMEETKTGSSTDILSLGFDRTWS